MKLNIAVAITAALAGLVHDLGTYRDSINKADQAGTKRPPFDLVSTALDVSIGFAGALVVSQIPGVA